MNLNPILAAIKAVFPFAVEQAQRTEAVIDILNALQVDLLKPKAVDVVYAWTLVEYKESKPEPIANLFREKEIKNAFWSAYTSNNPLDFLRKTEDFLTGKNDLINEIQNSGIELRSELEEFGKVFIEVAKRTKSKDFEPYPAWSLDLYPKEFKALIEEKGRTFCGRYFVFKAFEQFLDTNPKGYFTVLGDAGMGKSAIAAKYVSTKQCPCYFNDRAGGTNKPEQFLESIRQQLIKRYQLQNAEKDDLKTLLQKVSEKLEPDERLVIVVDALDEVNQEQGESNLLYLPKELPEQVYFLLTRRPYSPETKRFTVSPGVTVKELDLRDSTYSIRNREDIEKYIRSFLINDPEHKEALKKWIQERNIPDDVFVEQVADKSQNNFMYLRYVLPGIALGSYENLELKQLPDGLQDYYQVHWRLMNMEDDQQKIKVFILFILVEIGTPITCEMIAEIAEQDEVEVQNILEEWVEYVTDKEKDEETCYSFYHASFHEFLRGKKEFKSTRKLFKEVNQRISDCLYSNPI